MKNALSIAKMKANFKNVFKGKTVIVGIGNTMRGDDGFGPALIEKIKDEVKAVCIDTGTTPENYVGKITRMRPDTILLVDAVHLGLAPGEYDILRKSDIANCSLSTHDISAKMLIDFLEKETRADIYLLGVQPESLSFGVEMSDSVKKALIDLSGLIKEATDA